MTDVDLGMHQAGPAREEPPYFRSCERCSQPWPCLARRAELQAEGDEMKAARVDDARRIGVLTLVERGVSVWSSTRVDAYNLPLGGVVVEIEDVPSTETGEFERFFTCLDPTGSDRFPVTVRRIAESEIQQSGVEGTAASRITKLVKRLGGEVHGHKGSYLDPWIAERVRWMYVLTGLSNLAA
jgi:hypothetical protein